MLFLATLAFFGTPIFKMKHNTKTKQQELEKSAQTTHREGEKVEFRTQPGGREH
jgi:hypothetical protein